VTYRVVVVRSVIHRRVLYRRSQTPPENAQNRLVAPYEYPVPVAPTPTHIDIRVAVLSLVLVEQTQDVACFMIERVLSPGIMSLSVVHLEKRFAHFSDCRRSTSAA